MCVCNFQIKLNKYIIVARPSHNRMESLQGKVALVTGGSSGILLIFKFTHPPVIMMQACAKTKKRGFFKMKEYIKKKNIVNKTTFGQKISE